MQCNSALREREWVEWCGEETSLQCQERDETRIIIAAERHQTTIRLHRLISEYFWGRAESYHFTTPLGHLHNTMHSKLMFLWCAVCNTAALQCFFSLFFRLFELCSLLEWTFFFSHSFRKKMQWWLCDVCVIHSSGILILSQDSRHHDEFYCPFLFLSFQGKVFLYSFCAECYYWASMDECLWKLQ